jgi:hypothetical protein
LGPKLIQSPSLAACHSALAKHIASWRPIWVRVIHHVYCERVATECSRSWSAFRS